MALFDRFQRRRDQPVEPMQPAPPVPLRLPAVNQRITVMRAGHPPTASRVEDRFEETMLIAFPNMALADGERVVVSWEADDAWYSLESSVEAIYEEDHVPTVEVSILGRVLRHDERRADLRCQVSVPLSVRPVITRVVKPGQTLQTSTIEVSGKAVRFSTSAPFAPGDILESSLDIDGVEPISARLKVIRVDAASDSWRQVCTAVFDDMLRSDSSRLMMWLEDRMADQASFSAMVPPEPRPDL